MKKITKILLISLASFLLASFLLLSGRSKEVDPHNLSDFVFTWVLEEAPSDLIVDPIVDARDAIRKAQKIWIDTYGIKVIFDRPYKVSFDSTSNTWYVRGSLPPIPNIRGGTASIIFHEDGRVLAVWHGA